MKNKVFLSAYCHNNLGDDLFIHIICERYPNVQFYLIIPPSCDGYIKNIPNLHIIKRTFVFRLINKSCELIGKKKSLPYYLAKKCNLSIIIGGSMFIEDIDRPQKKIHYFKSLRDASKKMIVIGSNFGPYEKEDFFRSYYDFFTTLDDVCFRDKWSKQIFKEIEHVRYAPDVVLNLKVTTPLISSVKKRLTIIPILLDERNNLKQFRKQYIEILVELCEQAVSQNWEIMFMSFCEDQGDEIAIHNILSALSVPARKKSSCDFYSGNIKKSLKCLQESEAIVSTRFHGMILGWLLGKLVYPISYSNKMSNYLADISYKGYYSELTQLGPLLLTDILNEKNKVNIFEQKQQAKEQFAWLDHNVEML